MSSSGCTTSGVVRNDTSAEAELLLRKYEDNLAGLIMYGSIAYGRPRRGSIPDFWVIVKDLKRFHASNASFYRTGLNKPSTVAEQIRLNRSGPNFYACEEDGLKMKLAVIGLEKFLSMCRASSFTVKGRMQKPLRMFRSCPAIEEAITHARQDAARHGVNLVPREFDIHQFLHAAASLSYRAELRPENIDTKVREILDAGGDEMGRIYLPLLEELPYLRRTDGKFLDTRSPSERKRARRETLRYLGQCKWSREGIEFIVRNYRSYRTPLRYMWDKVIGEFLKGRDRLIGGKSGPRKPNSSSSASSSS